MSLTTRLINHPVKRIRAHVHRRRRWGRDNYDNNNYAILSRDLITT